MIIDRIIAAASKPKSLHELTMAIWPDLEQRGADGFVQRSDALTGIWYVRHCATRLLQSGKLQEQAGKLVAP